jgi:hypothetical protein
MFKILHATTGLLGGLTISIFFLSTLVAELAGGHDTIALVKRLIVAPGLFVLIPLMAMAGMSGRRLAGPSPVGVIRSKLLRMRWIALNGGCVLVPCALALNHWASQGQFDSRFVIVQAVELLAGLGNVILVGLNAAAGFRARSPAPRPEGAAL